MAIQNEAPSDLLNWPAHKCCLELPLRYFKRGPENGGIVYCLHGYQDHASSLLRRIGWSEGELPFQIVAINAPFPVPVWTADGFLEAYSWYFRDSSRGLEIYSPQQMAATLAKFLKEINFLKQPAVIFGFSQGGYLAAALGQHLPNLKGIIGLGCGYRHDIWEQLPKTEAHAIHGDLDRRIQIDQAENEFEAVLKLGHQGRFHRIDGLGHKVDRKVEPLVRQLALDLLARTT